jgi:small subunit ribosomal protein S18
MGRSNDRGSSSNNSNSNRRSPKDTGRRVKKKPCAICKDRIEWVDYKDVGMLRKYMSDRGKIRARRVSGNCAQHQRDIAMAIKTARELVLLPYTQRTTTERPGGRGGRGGREGGFGGPGGAGGAGRRQRSDSDDDQRTLATEIPDPPEVSSVESESGPAAATVDPESLIESPTDVEALVGEGEG